MNSPVNVAQYRQHDAFTCFGESRCESRQRAATAISGRCAPARGWPGSMGDHSLLPAILLAAQRTPRYWRVRERLPAAVEGRSWHAVGGWAIRGGGRALGCGSPPYAYATYQKAYQGVLQFDARTWAAPRLRVHCASTICWWKAGCTLGCALHAMFDIEIPCQL